MHYQKFLRPIQTQKSSSQSPLPKRLELTQEDLAAITGGFLAPINHNETVVSVAESAQSKQTPIVELSEEDLAADISGQYELL